MVSLPMTKKYAMQAWQILRRVGENKNVRDELLDALHLNTTHLDYVMEALREQFIDDLCEECGCCDGYHRKNFFGDCRNDDERF